MFLAEHNCASREKHETGLKCTRFIDIEKSSVLYLLRIEQVLMNIDSIDGLLFIRSVPIPFRASRYGGHAATVIQIEKVDIPTDLHDRRTEIVELLSNGLETYRLWFATAFWTEETC
jgi:hypothetical protein